MSELQSSSSSFNEVDKGLHSFRHWIEAWLHRFGGSFSDVHIVKFVIPKGTLYYKGKFGGFVSYVSEELVRV